MIRLLWFVVCSLAPQAAVYEAQAWMGSSAALLGRAHLVGPNPYASLVLVQGGPLKGRLPKMQTPYLVSSAGAATCAPLPVQLAKPSVIAGVRG